MFESTKLHVFDIDPIFVEKITATKELVHRMKCSAVNELVH